MDIDAAERCNINHDFGQYQAVGHYDHEFRPELAQLGLGFFALEGFRLKDRETGCQCYRFHRAGSQFATPAGGAVRLRVYPANFMCRLQQGFQWRDGEFRRTGKNDFHATPRAFGFSVPPSRCRCSFFTFFRASCLFSGDR